MVAGRGHGLGEGGEVGIVGGPQGRDALLLVVLDIGCPVLHGNRGLEEIDDLPTLRLRGKLGFRLRLEDRGGVARTHAGRLDRLGVGLGQRPEIPRRNRVCVATARVDLVGGKNRRVRDDVAGDLSQSALLTDRDGGLVEGHAAADRHEVALAGRCRLLRRVEERGVPVVDDDLAPVDTPRRVAPIGKRRGLLGKFLLEARRNGVGGVVEHRDVDASWTPRRAPWRRRRRPARKFCRPRATRRSSSRPMSPRQRWST